MPWGSTADQLDWVDQHPARQLQPGTIFVSSWDTGPHRITEIDGPCCCEDAPDEPHFHIVAQELADGSLGYFNGFRLDGTSITTGDRIAPLALLTHVSAQGPELLYWGWTDTEFGIAAERYKAWTGRTAKSSKPQRLQAWWHERFSYRPIDICCFIDPDFCFMSRVRRRAISTNTTEQNQ